MDKDQKQAKYLYIMENVAENGYDTTKFNNFLTTKFGSKLSLSNVLRVKHEYRKCII